MKRSLPLALAALATLAAARPGQATPAPAPAPTRPGADPAPRPEDPEPPQPGGTHWRLRTANGPVHVWAPPGYRHETAGIVVYVHGYYTTVDRAWRDHRLAAQFAASGRNALFIVPEAPARAAHQVHWRDLGALLREVAQHIPQPRPWGPVVAMGHSGAYRTLLEWLDDPVLDHVILIDALYAHEAPFRDWFERPRGHSPRRLTMVSIDTLRWSELLAAEIPHARTLDWIPEAPDDLDPTHHDAPLLYIRAPYGHMELVTGGKTIPVLLRMTRLPPLSPQPVTHDAAGDRVDRAP